MNAYESTIRTHEQAGLQRSAIRIRRGLTVLAATLAAVAGWFVWHDLVGIDLELGGQAAGTATYVTAGATAAGALLSALGGWTLLAILERSARRPLTPWTITAGFALVVSLVGPLEAKGGASILALESLHLMVGAIVIAGMRLSTRSDRSAGA